MSKGPGFPSPATPATRSRDPSLTRNEPDAKAILPEPRSVHSPPPMKWMIRLLLCLLAAPLFARSSYPPTFKDARVETYRTIGSTELKLWKIGVRSQFLTGRRPRDASRKSGQEEIIDRVRCLRASDLTRGNRQQGSLPTMRIGAFFSALPEACGRMTNGRPPQSPTPVPVLTASGAAGAKANSCSLEFGVVWVAIASTFAVPRAP